VVVAKRDWPKEVNCFSFDISSIGSVNMAITFFLNYKKKKKKKKTIKRLDWFDSAAIISGATLEIGAT
jgi:hypothetical protein